MKKNKAFTLVELLVVISIIAMLLAILMPSLNKARLLAQRIVCMNSAKQIFVSQMNYATANNGKFAPNWSASGPWTVRDARIKGGMNKYGETAGSAYDYYKDYIKASELFLCPAIKQFAVETPRDWGMCRETTWYDAGYTAGLDKGGWDATRPGKPNEKPNYIVIPYNWYTNYTPCTINGTTASPIDSIYLYNGAIKWPRNTSECSSTRVMMSHIFMCDKGYSKFRDMGHGGSTAVWMNIGSTRIDGPIITTSGRIKSIDNPVVYADGHTKYVMKSDIRLRVRYDSSAGNANSKNATFQIAW